MISSHTLHPASILTSVCHRARLLPSALARLFPSPTISLHMSSSQSGPRAQAGAASSAAEPKARGANRSTKVAGKLKVLPEHPEPLLQQANAAQPSHPPRDRDRDEGGEGSGTLADSEEEEDEDEPEDVEVGWPSRVRTRSAS